MNAGISNAMRKRVYARDRYRCVLCDSDQGIQIHHVVPRGKGGTDYLHNLATLCWRCHAAIHGTQFYDFPDWMTPKELRQALVEYMADYYAETQGRLWNPWVKKLEDLL